MILILASTHFLIGRFFAEQDRNVHVAPAPEIISQGDALEFPQQPKLN
jgi:hypothetical protein